jgi:hypothetical protein
MPRSNVPAPKGKGKFEEIVKCGTDPLYFLKRYCYISHPKKGLIKFDTYPFQDDCIRDFETHRHNIVLKSRQLGLSTICAGYCLWMALFQKERNIVVLATRLDVAKNFLRKVSTMYDSLPDWLVMPKEKGRTVKSIEFTNGSRITAVPTGDDAGRGEGITLLIVDEAAHIQGFDELWMGLYSTVSTGGNIILLSTPKGVGNVFHKVWMGSDLEKDENDFHGIKLLWTVHPEHDEAWFQEQCRNLDPRGIQQELLCSFLGSGQTYLHETSISYINENIRPPIEHLGDDGNIWVWKYPVTGHKYLISADVARGDSDDYSTSHVIDVDADEVVAEYQGKIPPDRFAELLADLGRKYFTATICPENNTFGLATAYRLRDLKYPNLYYEKFAKAGVYQHYTDEEVKSLMPGLSTTVKNRQAILAKLEEVLRNKKIKVYSSRFAEEAKTFIWNTNVAGGRAQAMKGYNDDLIMSLAIGCYLYDASGTQVDNEELNRAMLAAWGKSTTRLNNADYSATTPQLNETGAQHMAFQRSSQGSEYVHQEGSAPYFKKEVTQQNMKAGVNIEQAKPTISAYNLYSWLFGN